jgi:hypothetical protein
MLPRFPRYRRLLKMELPFFCKIETRLARAAHVPTHMQIVWLFVIWLFGNRYGDWLPRTIFGKGWAVCAYFRMVYVAVVVLLVQRKSLGTLYSSRRLPDFSSQPLILAARRSVSIANSCLLAVTAFLRSMFVHLCLCAFVPLCLESSLLFTSYDFGLSHFVVPTVVLLV